MEAQELLNGVFTKTLNLTEEEVSDLLYQKAEDSDELVMKEDALNLVLDRDATRITNIKTSVKPDKKRLSDEYGRGVKETMDKFETSAKELYDVESDTHGLDLVKEIVNSVSECNVITDENVKKHPVYLELEKRSISKEKYDTLDLEFKDFKLNQDKNSRLSRVSSNALTVLGGLNPIISEDTNVAQTRQRGFMNELGDYEYEEKEDGNHLITKNGNRLEDEHAHPIKFNNFVANVAKNHYEFQVSDDKGNAGNSNDGKGGGAHTDVPKTEEEYHSRMAALMVLGDREGTVKLQKAWEESQKVKT